MASGFGLAVALAVPFGVVLGRSPLAAKLFEPTINIIRPIPVTAWALLVVGEMVGINLGLGAMIFEGRQLNQIDLIMAGMVIIGVLGFLSDRLLSLLLKLPSRGRPILQEVT